VNSTVDDVPIMNDRTLAKDVTGQEEVVGVSKRGSVPCGM
jgi:hypothetical protein